MRRSSATRCSTAEKAATRARCRARSAAARRRAGTMRSTTCETRQHAASRRRLCHLPNTRREIVNDRNNTTPAPRVSERHDPSVMRSPRPRRRAPRSGRRGVVKTTRRRRRRGRASVRASALTTTHRRRVTRATDRGTREHGVRRARRFPDRLHLQGPSRRLATAGRARAGGWGGVWAQARRVAVAPPRGWRVSGAAAAKFNFKWSRRGGKYCQVVSLSSLLRSTRPLSRPATHPNDGRQVIGPDDEAFIRDMVG